MSDWQPIETAPKDGTEVLAFYPPYDFHVLYFDAGGWNAWTDVYGEHKYASPTHWMPLPAAPQEPGT